MNEPIYKASHQIKTGDFEYIKIDCEGTLDAIVTAHKALQATWKVSEGGLPPIDWRVAVDHYRSGKGLPPDVWERMNAAQKWFFSEIDKSDGRMAPKIPAKRECNHRGDGLKPEKCLKCHVDLTAK